MPLETPFNIIIEESFAYLTMVFFILEEKNPCLNKPILYRSSMPVTMVTIGRLLTRDITLIVAMRTFLFPVRASAVSPVCFSFFVAENAEGQLCFSKVMAEKGGVQLLD